MNGDLLQKIEEYLDRTGISAGRFGQLACSNTRLVERLRDGGRVWPETEEKIRSFLSSRMEPAE